MPYGDTIPHTSNLESKLNLRPLGGYEESLDALESLLEEEYDTVAEAAVEMHPRVSHEVFRYPEIKGKQSAVLENVMVETVQDVLEDNSELEYSWFGEKLFNLGYSRFPKSPELRDLNDTPSVNHASEEIPVTPFTTVYGRGKKKREADEHYLWANNFLIENMANQEIIIK